MANVDMANKIAELIISKSFWGNEWFAIFSLLLVGLVAATSAWGATYLSTKSQNAAIRSDFKKALKNLEKQTSSVKGIEESISHDFIEKREQLKIRRTKIEELYLALTLDLEQLAYNLRIATLDASKDLIMPSGKAEMLAYLYFKVELEKEIEYFCEQRGALTSRIRELCEENMNHTVFIPQARIDINLVYISNFNQAIRNIEIGLESEMRNLTRQLNGTKTVG